MLERDGLVKQSGNRGVIVADVTPEEADELLSHSWPLIGLAARLACQRMKGERSGAAWHELVDKASKRRRREKIGMAFLDVASRVGAISLCERSFSPRLAHLFEVMAIRARAIVYSMCRFPDTWKRWCAATREFATPSGPGRRSCGRAIQRFKVMDFGRDLLRRYFIEPYGRLKSHDSDDDPLMSHSEKNDPHRHRR